MSRTWKPGDLARIELVNGVVHPIALRLPIHEGGWATGRAKYVNSVHVTNARPLIVIDPENREQVERLRDLWDAAYEEQQGVAPTHRYKGERGNAMQAALREYANPTPPKPAEPTDLAMRVHAAGTTWAKIANWWVPVAIDECPRVWDWLIECDDFRVLREGVTA